MNANFRKVLKEARKAGFNTIMQADKTEESKFHFLSAKSDEQEPGPDFSLSNLDREVLGWECRDKTPTNSSFFSVQIPNTSTKDHIWGYLHILRKVFVVFELNSTYNRQC